MSPSARNDAMREILYEMRDRYFIDGRLADPKARFLYITGKQLEAVVERLGYGLEVKPEYG